MADQRAFKIRLTLVVCTVVFAADRVTKELARAFLADGEPEAIRVLKGVFYLRWSTNPAGFFGALEGIGEAARPAFFLLSTALFAGFLVYLLSRSSRSDELQALTLILGGVLGNGVDRLLYGHVIDCAFLVVPRRTSFNIADLAIFVGIVWMVVISLVGRARAKPGEESRA